MLPVKRELLQALLIRALLTWVLFIPIAIMNGIIRESVYKPIVGDLTAHQISSIIASLAFIVLAYFMLNKLIINVNNTQLLLIGLMWLVMTILFEFGFGHYVDKVSWEGLLNDYNIFKGRLWGLVLLTLFITPLLVKKIHLGWLHQKQIANVTHQV